MSEPHNKPTLSRREMTGLAVAAAALAAMPAEAAQAHMENALAHCQAGLKELKAANDNKGGYRANAIEHLEFVIDQIKRGISYAG